MRVTRLIRIAAEAEALRLRQFARRQAGRLVLGLIALVFLAAAVAVAHAVGYLALRLVLKPVFAALIILGIDLVLGAVFGMLAARSSPGQVEREALAVRRQAVAYLEQSVALWTVLTPILRYVPRRSLYSLLLAALTARYLAGARRR
jgi:hypothetical protein